MLEHFPDISLLSPIKEMLEPLIQTAAAVGLSLDVTSTKALANSFDVAVAVYFSSGDLSTREYGHYGLAAPLYTHLTSPIRRYADVIVHHLLAASLGICKLPCIFQDKPRLTSIADNLNY